jgi:hypothetical protein
MLKSGGVEVAEFVAVAVSAVCGEGAGRGKACRGRGLTLWVGL